MNILIKKQDWETEQLAGIKGNYGKVVVSMSPESQPSTVAMSSSRTEQSSATSLPLPERCQDHILNPEG